MALLHFDGFRSYESYVDFKATELENVVLQDLHTKGNFYTACSRFGSPNRGLYLEDAGIYHRCTLSSSFSPATIIMGFVFKKMSIGDPTLSAPSYPMFEIGSSSATIHLRGYLDSARNFRVYRDTIYLGISSGKVVQDLTWHILELKLYVHDSAGTVELKLDGVQILDLTGQDTLTGSNNYCRFFEFAGIHYDKITYYDCWYLLDDTGSAPCNTFLGDVRCEIIRPDGNGSQTDFTPLVDSSAGDNWENVDDIYPDDDTTYNFSDTVNDQDLYTVESLPSPPDDVEIFGIKPAVCLSKTDAGAKGAKILTRLTTTTYKSNEVTPPFGSYMRYGKIYENNPDDSSGALWTDADIDGIEVGVEISS